MSKQKYAFSSVWVSLLLGFSFSFLCEAVRLNSIIKVFAWVAEHTRAYCVGAIALSLIACALLYACRRAGACALILGGILFIGSFANYYKTAYRGDPLLPIDFVIALDAAKVSGELKMSFTIPMIIFALIVAALAALLWRVKLPLAKSKKIAAVRAAISLAGIPVLLLFLAISVWNTALMKPIGVRVIPGNALLAYQNSGFVTGYLLYISDLKPSRPKGYSKSTMSSLSSELVQSEVQEAPDIIVVMLESYFHLSNYPKAVIEEELPNYKRLMKEGISGYYMSDKYSGGTADMEFGALTGFSTSFLPSGSVPYSEFVSQRKTPSYPSYLKTKGYLTTAIHPYDPTIYKRDKAYPNMGFDEFISQDDFSDTDTKGVYISDKAAMDKIIEVYEAKRNSGPVFIHTVTMQNHIPHLKGNYEDGYEVKASYPDAGSELNSALSAMVTGLRDEDAAIGYLTDYFKKQDRKAVILFFGDHQTSIGNENGAELLDFAETLSGLPQEAKVLKTHNAPYLMWANYKSGNEDTTAGFFASYQLLAQMSSLYDLPRPSWFTWLYKSHDIIAGTNLGYTLTHTGGLEFGTTIEQEELLQKQKLLQYDALLGEGYAYDNMYN